MVGRMTVADVDRKIRDALPGIATVIHEVRQQLRAEFEAEILRLSALLAEVTKRQAIDEARKSGVVALPKFIGSRHG